MNKRKVTSFFIASLRNKMLIAILAVSLISAGGIILSTQNNFFSNNSINNKTILAQKEVTKHNSVTNNKSNAKVDKSSLVLTPKVQEQVSKDISHEVNVIKTNYLDELSTINEQANNLISGNVDDTQSEINESSYKVYNLWNNELNKIYSSLKTTLTSEQMAKLQSEEINWIIYKEQVANETSKEYGGGSIYGSVVNLKLANLTKERCYYLINNYM